MYFDTSLKTSRRDCSGISCHALVTQFRNFSFFQRKIFREREEMDGRDALESDEIEELKRVIRALLFGRYGKVLVVAGGD
jgi:hypothetical protein